jgi:hypothetical protein
MRTPDIEAVATHGGPGSCVGDPRVRSEALRGVRAGEVIEPRNQVCSGCRRRVVRRKAISPVALARESPVDPARSHNLGMRGVSRRENREILRSPVVVMAGRAARGTLRRYALDAERRKSDRPVLPAKLPNKAGVSAAEAVEGRGLGKGNAASNKRPGLRARQGAPSAFDRVRRVARSLSDPSTDL